jgi:hypothetical protein
MGEVVRFVPKSELERARLIGEARAIYESIFPDAEGPGSQDVGGDKSEDMHHDHTDDPHRRVDPRTKTWNEPKVSVGSIASL